MSDDSKENAGQALRRAILAALGEIDARLAGEQPGETDVHLARRAAKRARALAKLAPAKLDVLARHTRNGVAAARRRLGGARDAQVRRQTLAELAPGLGDAHAGLATLLAGEDAAAAAADAHAARDEIVSLIRDWELCDADCDLSDLVEAAGATYRRARKRARRARAGGTEELHHWRTAVVDLEYHAGFLMRYAPALRRLRSDADRLREHLGDVNDLDDLACYVGEREADAQSPAMRALERASARRRAKSLSKALALGDKLFDRPARRWTESVKRSCGI